MQRNSAAVSAYFRESLRVLTLFASCFSKFPASSIDENIKGFIRVTAVYCFRDHSPKKGILQAPSSMMMILRNTTQNDSIEGYLLFCAG